MFKRVLNWKISSEIGFSVHICRNSKLLHFKNSKILRLKRSNLKMCTTYKHQFYTNCQINSKFFHNSENDYAYNVIKSLPRTEIPVFNIRNVVREIETEEEFNNFMNQKWREKTGTEIVDGFNSTKKYCITNNVPVSDTRFDKLVDGLMDRVQDLTDAELVTLLVFLRDIPSTESYDSHNYHDMWSALDDICCQRINNWSIEKRFGIAEYWYHLNLARIGDYVHSVVNTCEEKAGKLSKENLMFLLFFEKATYRKTLTFGCQYGIGKYINEMTLQEIAFAMLVYLKSRKAITLDRIWEIIINKLIEECQTATSVEIANILQVSGGVLSYFAYWNSVAKQKFIKYVIKLVTILSNNTEHLSKTDLVRAYFYLNLMRNRFVDRRFEKSVLKHIHELTVDEIAIISMGYFKTQSPITNSFLLSRILRQVCEDCRKIHEVSLTAILKVLRYSAKSTLLDQITNLLNRLIPEIDRLSIFCCVHLALLGTTLQFYHEPSITKVTEKLLPSINKPSEVRLKDMERLLLPLTMFDMNPDIGADIYKVIFDELHTDHRRAESLSYKKSLLSALGYLSIRNIYSYEFMDILLHPDYILEHFGKSSKMVPRELFVFDTSIDIECPGYKGSRLSQDMRKKVARWLTDWAPTIDQPKTITSADQLFLDIQECLTIITKNKKCVCPSHVLPHFAKPDLIICKERGTGRYVQPPGLEDFDLSDLKRPIDTERFIWFSVNPIGPNAVIRNTMAPVGLINMKFRQLRAIGYHPIMVMWNEFGALDKEEKIEYLLKKLSEIK